eukprot:s657_g1.t1
MKKLLALGFVDPDEWHHDWQNWSTEDDEWYAHEWAQWESDAFDGHATSARGPVSTPQARRLLDFSNEVHTPPGPKVVDPMKKVQLAAAKRLEKQLRQNGESQEPKVPETKPTAKVNGKGKNAKGKNAKGKNAKGKAKDDEKPKKVYSGPLTEAMKKFLKEKKEQGLSHREAQQLWKSSDERSAITGPMSDRERKRRRY